MKIIVQNLAAEYQDEGAGETVLFLHGWMDDSRTFDPLIQKISAGKRTVRLDLPGFGKTEAPREAWDLDRYVSFVRDFAAKIHLETYVLVGHSFGGRIAIKGIASGAFHPRSVILIGSAGIARRSSARASLLKAAAKVGKAALSVLPLVPRERLKARLYDSIGSDYGAAGGLKETFVKIVSEDLSDAARKIDVPTLLVWGIEDAATPLADGQRLATLIPSARLETIAGAGHFIHREKPEEVAKLIRDFTC